MAARRQDAAWLAAGLCLAALVSLKDAGNPDLFWHLSVGDRILEEGRLPRADFLSHTKAGAPWRPYEWLTHVLYALAFRAAGGWGLVALKTAWLTAAAACAAQTLRLLGWKGPVLALSPVLLCAGWNLVNEARADNSSVFFFAAALWALEAGRLGRLGPRAGAGFLAAGCLWANLHPGFAYGLSLCALYALDALARRDGARARLFGTWLLCAAAGTLANPFGPSLYALFFEHASHAGAIGRRLVEWRPPEPLNALALPFWALLLLSPAAALAAWARGRRPAALPWVLFAAAAALALRHQRAAPFFVLSAAAALGRTLAEAAGGAPRLSARAAGAGLALVLLYFAGVPAGLSRSGLSLSAYPVAAADYLAARAPELSGLKLYNPWGWGGYLGWRLKGAYPVYFDGRDLFLDMLEEEELHLSTSPRRWQEILERRGVALAVMMRGLPDAEGRPYHELFMPRERWVLLHEDPAALVFARRDRLPAKMLTSARGEKAP